MERRNSPAGNQQNKDYRRQHRQRVRERIVRNGIGSLSDYEVLEYILFYTQPQKDTKQLAHRLIDKFCNLHGVIGAPISELAEVDGVGECTAHFLHHLRDIFEIYSVEKNTPRSTLSATQVVPYVRFLLKKEKRECIYVVYLTEKQEVIATEKIAEGDATSVQVKLKPIMEGVVRHKDTKRIILAHNHPSLSVKPSRNDMKTTVDLITVLDCMGIKMLDHLIVAKDGVVFSFFLKGVFSPEEAGEEGTENTLQVAIDEEN